MNRHCLMVIGAVAGVLALTGAADALMPRPDQPVVAPLTQSIVCVGNRRTYRDFNHCKQYIGNSNAYCSRICR